MGNPSVNKFFLLIVTVSAWFGIMITLYGVLTNPAPLYPADMLVANFISYFTIQSNIIVALVATSWLFNKEFFGKYQRLFELGGLINISITFVVVALVLSKLSTLTGIDLFADHMVHIVTPILYVGYWLLFREKLKIAYKYMILWLGYPILYFVYSLIRGSIVGWYPYPFINASILSVGELAVNVVLLTFAFLVVGSIFVFITNKFAANKD